MNSVNVKFVYYYFRCQIVHTSVQEGEEPREIMMGIEVHNACMQKEIIVRRVEMRCENENDAGEKRTSARDSDGREERFAKAATSCSYMSCRSLRAVQIMSCKSSQS